MAGSGLTAEQRRVLQLILKIGSRRGESPKEIKAAVETGLVESNLRNLKYGDADSQGWRQERTSLYPNPTNLRASINRFYDETSRVQGQYGTAGALAAAVQRPAAQYRGRYQQASGQAQELLGLGGAAPQGQTVFPLAIRPPQAATFDQAGYEKAKRAALVGGLIAKRKGTNSILFKTGLLTTQMPSAADFQGAGGAPTSPQTGHATVGKTLVIGDSLGVGTLPFLERMVGSGKVTASVLGGRPSSKGVDVLRNLVRNGTYQNIVFDLGTNDATVGELRRSLRMLNQLAPDVHIVIPTINSPFQPGAKNQLLRTYARNHPNVQLVGWQSGSNGLLAGDGIHATTQGYQARARMIAKALGWSAPAGGGAAAPQGKGTFKITGPNPGRLKPLLVGFARRVAATYGQPLTGSDGTGHSYLTTSGNVSEHTTGNATDIPLVGNALIAAGRAALVTAGWSPQQAARVNGGLFNVYETIGGRRVRHQIIFNTQEGGDHTDHLHLSSAYR